MAGTREGGLKASQTNKQKYGENFYKNIGQTGGIKSRGGGFAYNDSGSIAGQIGGMKSAYKRYGTPIDEAKLKQLEKELKLLNS
jgi:hypothetical protein